MKIYINLFENEFVEFEIVSLRYCMNEDSFVVTVSEETKLIKGLIKLDFITKLNELTYQIPNLDFEVK